jgi:hydroxymethylbilane synthase
MQNQKIYKIGTRGSLLALTQCLQLKAEMEASGLGKFELKIISTQGDEDTSKPLWQLDGKDFFTKELDAALLNEEVDMVVHSYKDLGSERPEGIKLAAITQRKFPHDILFIKKSIVEKLKRKEVNKLVVGTSSPRRMTNITKHLNLYLPFGESVEIETQSLRGNVNTRLEKCNSEQYDAIVLALPGIERLATGLDTIDNEAYERHGDPREILKELLAPLEFMILPTSQFPAAASQGALGVECLESNTELLGKLNSLNCERTIREVKKEREVFASFGGGCHLAVGITARNVSDQTRLNVLGEADNKEVEQNTLLVPPPEIKVPLNQVFIGVETSKGNTVSDKLIKKTPLNPNMTQQTELTDILFASGRAFEYAKVFAQENPQAKLWSSGTRTWKKMAANGFWCHGSADALGENELAQLRSSRVISLMSKPPQWCVVTNDNSNNILGQRLAVYKSEPISLTREEKSDEYKKQIEETKAFYWTSFKQYEDFKTHYNLDPNATFYCGLGKTHAKFKDNNIKVHPVSGMKEFKNMCKELK